LSTLETACEAATG